MSQLIINMLIESIFASIASVGFAMVFNVPRHTLIYCAVVVQLHILQEQCFYI